MGDAMNEKINPTAGALLGLLRDGERSGYDLMAAAELTIGAFWTITRSQIYRELADLAERGLVQRGRPGPRDRQPYRITQAGRKAFREWVNRPPEPESLRIPLLLHLTFADEIDSDTLRATLAEHKEIHTRRLAEYRQLDSALKAAGVPVEARVTLAHGIAYEAAVLKWMATLPRTLTHGDNTS